MKKKNIFCFGFGQVAQSFIKKLNFEKNSFNLITTSRKKTSEKKFDKFKYKSLQFEGDNFDIKIIDEIKKASHILVSTPPETEDHIIKNFLKTIQASNSLKWFAYLSSTVVYGNHDGRWVNEETSTIPTTDRGIRRLKAELKFKNLNLPLVIFRLSGIYSNENNVFKRLKENMTRIIEMENKIFSRVHVEDIANILYLSLNSKNIFKGEIFNLSDNFPCSYKEVVEYACKLSDISLPKIISLDELKDRKLKDFYKDSKRVSNKKMKEFFKYKLKYPTYIEGLKDIKNHLI